eukprot:335320-Amphidinium_carterae.4
MAWVTGYCCKCAASQAPEHDLCDGSRLLSFPRSPLKLLPSYFNSLSHNPVVRQAAASVSLTFNQCSS